jgi:methylenetetrahydrofolate--tRNA-(uracil-5-)-methyltransferase
MNANFGLLDDLEGVPAKVLKDKTKKRELFAERGLAHMMAWREAHALGVVGAA